MITKTIQGLEVPALGYGTYELTGDECRKAVVTAIETGYRHIDTARMYRNEAEIGDALAATGIERDALFLTSKVWFEDLTYDAVLEEVNTSLRALRTDYLDLILIHWPNEEISLRETFAAMEKLHELELVRKYGVSNFTPQWLQKALGAGNIFCNQVEYHPLLRPQRLHDMAVEHDLLLTAYSPLARGKLHGWDVLEAIAQKHGKSPEQVAIRWLLQQDNMAAIPRSSNPDHIRENFNVFDFTLDHEDFRRIEELPDDKRLIDPEFAPAWEK